MVWVAIGICCHFCFLLFAVVVDQEHRLAINCEASALVSKEKVNQSSMMMLLQLN